MSFLSVEVFVWPLRYAPHICMTAYISVHITIIVTHDKEVDLRQILQ